MSRIERLTPEQERLLPEWHEEWFRVGTCTDPADRGRAEAAITKMYERIGYEPPEFLWVDSPIALHPTAQADGGRDSLWDSLRGSLRGSLWASLRVSLQDSLGGSLRVSLWDSLWGSLRDSLGGSLRTSLWGSLRDSLWDWRTPLWGQHDACWIAFYRFCEEIGVEYDPEDAEALSWHEDIARSCMWWWPYEGVCVVSERPSVVAMDDRERIHSEDGPAVALRDGWAVWAWHGVRVPQRVIEEPETLSVEEALREENVEVRRVMLARIGPERLMREGGLEVVDEITDDAVEVAQGEDGLPIPVGLRGARLLRMPSKGDEMPPMQWVSLVNSTPEPDGSRKRYHLRVPPNARSVREAVAWTFGVDAEDYAPVQET